MLDHSQPIAAPSPESLIDGVDQAAYEVLAIADIGRALHDMTATDGIKLVGAVHRTIEANYARSGASANKNRSNENWRWRRPQVNIAKHNRSAEVIIERAIVAACQRLGRDDWSNQVPVSSGLVQSTSDRRRNIDLVRRRGDLHFELIELKIASNKSNSPLYAAIQLIGYSCLWLIARGDRPSRPSALLDADRIDLRVLAPDTYYCSFPKGEVGVAFDAGMRALGQRSGVTMTFAFAELDKLIRSDAVPDDRTLLACLDHQIASNSDPFSRPIPTP